MRREWKAGTTGRGKECVRYKVSNCYKDILAEGARALSVTLSGGALFAS